MRIESAIRRVARRDDRRPCDTVLVLGAGVRPDGHPGPFLEARLKHAEDLYHEGLAPTILISGGPGQSGYVEAQAARRQALEDGIPAEAILTEERSTNTWENFLFSRDVMREHHLRTALVSTDPFHERRSLRIAHELGMHVYGSPVESGPALDPATEDRRMAREVKSTLEYEACRRARQ